MAIAQGINKILTFKKQTGLGVPASGSGGQLFRRVESNFDLKRDSFENNEIVSHQQSTGVTLAGRKVEGSLKGVLSMNTYSTLFASLLRKNFAATTPLTGISVTIAGSAPTFTVTIASGSYLTNGFKIGDVMRLSVGTLNAANINKNLLITNLTATVATVRVVNGVAMFAEGPIAGCTLTVIGKKCIAPTSGHTADYWTVEEWHPDITSSEVSTDVMVGGCDINVTAKGNTDVSFSFVGLNQTRGATQVLTTPTAATTTEVLNGTNGVLLVNGAAIANITAISIKIDGNSQAMDGVVGSLVSPDVQRGRVKVTGQISAYFQDGVLPGYFDAGTTVSAVIVMAADSTAASEFHSFVIPALNLTDASSDDGEKGLMLTLPFTAKLNASGGAALANDQTIISLQDSLAA